MIEGIPSYAWECEMAARILGSSCDIESLAPETASREDLSLFKLRAWCLDPELVPMEKRLWIPEPPEDIDNPVARRPRSSRMQEYPTLVHIGRMRDFSPPENWRRPPSSDGSGQSRLPDDSEDFLGGGDRVVLPWTRGMRDNRGSGLAGGTAGAGARRTYCQALLGRLGPSDWRLPAMEGTFGSSPRSVQKETNLHAFPALVPDPEVQARAPTVALLGVDTLEASNVGHERNACTVVGMETGGLDADTPVVIGPAAGDAEAAISMHDPLAATEGGPAADQVGLTEKDPVVVHAQSLLSSGKKQARLVEKIVGPISVPVQIQIPVHPPAWTSASGATPNACPGIDTHLVVEGREQEAPAGREGYVDVPLSPPEGRPAPVMDPLHGLG